MTTVPPLNRRSFILVSASAAVTASVIACGDTSYAWRFFTGNEIQTLAAVCDRIIPPDDDPGAVQAGVLNYIDRKIVGYFARHRDLYRQGLKKLTESSLALFQKRFEELPAEKQDTLLRHLENNEVDKSVWQDVSPSGFFNTVIDHTLQGYFGDPRHGGNRYACSWKMMGVPQIPVRSRRPPVRPETAPRVPE